MRKPVTSPCPRANANPAHEDEWGMLSIITDTMYNDSLLCARCEMDGARKNTDNTTTAIDTVPAQQKLTVAMFPNPAEDYVILQLNQATTSPLIVKVTDEIGNVIFNETGIFTGSAYNINTSGFSSGIYNVTLYNDNDKLFGGKLVIFHK